MKVLVAVVAAVLTVTIILTTVIANINYQANGRNKTVVWDNFNINIHKYAVKSYTAGKLPVLAAVGFSESNEWSKGTNGEIANVTLPVLSDMDIAVYQNQGNGLEKFLAQTANALLNSEKDNNTVYSPLNLYLSLAMLAEMTEGESRQQILDLVGEDSIEALRTRANAIFLANSSDGEKSICQLANSLWIDDEFIPKLETVVTLAKYHYAESYNGDLQSDEILELFRSWSRDKTHGLLDKQINEIDFSEDAKLAFMSMLYVKADWQYKFDGIFNGYADFNTHDGAVSAEYMNRTGTMTYYRGARFASVASELQGGGRMFFILPDEGVDVDLLLSDEDALMFMTLDGNWKNKEERNVHISVPKFDINQKTDLTSELPKLGITECFSLYTADFSPLSGLDMMLFLGKYEHVARLVIAEEGIEGLAYTFGEVNYGYASADILDFILDRPFVFVVTSSDGFPVFSGVVNDPTAN